MDTKLWSVVVLSPNKFLSKLQADLFRDAGAKSIQIAHTEKQALKLATDYAANVIAIDLSEATEESLKLVKSIRRLAESPAKRAFIFGVSNKMTTNLVELCRLAGVNAAIGLPLSRTSLIQTVKKVTAKPREFIEVEGYIGPCRRAGIVSVNAAKNKRRTADAGQALSPDGNLKSA